AAAAVAAVLGAAASGGHTPRITETNVSDAPGYEAETAIAGDASGRLLLAGANVSRNDSDGTRAYVSTHGGATWTTSNPFPRQGRICAIGDPAPAVGEHGVQLLAFLTIRCDTDDDELVERSLVLRVAYRTSASGTWKGSRVAPSADKPALVVDTQRR